MQFSFIVLSASILAAPLPILVPGLQNLDKSSPLFKFASIFKTATPETLVTGITKSQAAPEIVAKSEKTGFKLFGKASAKVHPEIAQKFEVPVEDLGLARKGSSLEEVLKAKKVAEQARANAALTHNVAKNSQ